MEHELRLRIGETGRIIIPAVIRKQLGMKIGDPLILKVENRELRISTLQERIEEAQASVRKYIDPSRFLSQDLIAERRKLGGHSSCPETDSWF